MDILFSGGDLLSVEILKKIIDESDNIVFFGGAGTSTESNIPDFRTADTGLYSSTGQKYAPEVMLSHSFFMNHTKEFYEFYKEKMIYKDALPNLAHVALGNLEKRGKLKAIITQNIDGLHQRAGSKNVLELHGSVYRNYCMDCREKYSLDIVTQSSEVVPKCIKCGGIIKPDVVLYEEGLDNYTIQRAVEYIANADVLIVGGTSLVVYPAAGLIEYYRGNKLILINKSTTAYDNRANLLIQDSIGKVLNVAIGEL
ncbi:MAG: NAD-dependent protein deacylase [Anaeromicrobium sp.]|uniref:NAD-dependent protein deacylase n=1 Tax=Anaeromicrobium sp. TaxID=1929132 RepID=UPI0025EFD122|nr:NAD-dependent protein deacylase [Anaeromicrobium sp.]MCT4594158.1 NAD-dependent protein deacylase [Anaeromicrobium sp.]